MQRNLILLPALIALSGGRGAAAQCEQPVSGRLLFIGGAYVAGEAAGVLIRHGDWWPDSARTFNVTWGRSPSANQDGFLHATIAYQAAQAATLAFDWACLSSTTAGWLGSVTGVAIALPKEIGDGFHGTGFSGSDMLFTAAGAALPGLHRAVPSLKAINLKATYWPSAELRNRIGSQPHLETDYAGQRFFLTFSPGLLPGGSGAWPRWLGAGVGHGTPAWVTAPATNDWYVALDLNVRGLPIHGAVWRHVAALLDQIHLPLPGLRLRGGTVAAGLY